MMKSTFIPGVLLIAVVLSSLSFPGSASADEVILSNGDRLTGTVSSLKNGVLTLETSYSEPVKIQASSIRKILTDSSVETHLSSGEILKGRISTNESGQITLAPSSGRQASLVELDQIIAINPPPMPPEEWRGFVNIGGTLNSGNTDRLSGSLGVEAVRKTTKDRFTLRFQTNYAEEDSARTVQNTYGALKYDYFFAPKFYGYLGVELLTDEFKDLNLRTIIGPGVGYQIWDDAVKALALEAGVSYFSEDLDVGEDKDWITARLAANFMYMFFDKIIFTDYLVVYPNLEQGGEYTLRNEAAITSPLSENWSIRFANIFEYNSNPAINVKKDDTTWILGIQYGF